jgi:hypothetical protein
VDAIDADLRVLGLAVPDAPAQALDLRRRSSPSPPRAPVLGRQHAGDLRQVLQPHGEVEPVEHRRRGDAGVEPGCAAARGSRR